MRGASAEEEEGTDVPPSRPAVTVLHLPAEALAPPLGGIGLCLAAAAVGAVGAVPFAVVRGVPLLHACSHGSFAAVMTSTAYTLCDKGIDALTGRYLIPPLELRLTRRVRLRRSDTPRRERVEQDGASEQEFVITSHMPFPDYARAALAGGIAASVVASFAGLRRPMVPAAAVAGMLLACSARVVRVEFWKFERTRAMEHYWRLLLAKMEDEGLVEEGEHDEGAEQLDTERDTADRASWPKWIPFRMINDEEYAQKVRRSRASTVEGRIEITIEDMADKRREAARKKEDHNDS